MRRARSRRLGSALVIQIALALTLPSFASAAWPGGDGLLAVQPARGGGITLLTPAGRPAGRICPLSTRGGRCAPVPAATWSPDGRTLAFASRRAGVEIVYEDGSCLNCDIAYTDELDSVGTPVSLPDRQGVVFAADGRLWQTPIDGIGPDPGTENPGAPIEHGAKGADADVSSTGELAFVRAGRILVAPSIDGRPRTLAAGSEPAWSPDGRAIAYTRAGRVWVVSTVPYATPHRPRALAVGTAPAFAPDGRLVAFLDARGDPSVVATRGGPARTLSRHAARHLDWQPIVHAAPTCPELPGAQTVYESGGVTVAERGDAYGEEAFTACLAPTGVARVVDRASVTSYLQGTYDAPFGFVSAGAQLAFQEDTANDPLGTGDTYDVAGENLATGRRFSSQTGGTGESFACCTTPTFVGTAFTLSPLLVDPAGDVAWLTTATGYTTDTTTGTTGTTGSDGAASATTSTTTTNSSSSTTQQITVHAAGAIYATTLETAPQTGPTPPLQNLQLTDGTVSWTDQGQPRSTSVAPSPSASVRLTAGAARRTPAAGRRTPRRAGRR